MHRSREQGVGQPLPAVFGGPAPHVFRPHPRVYLVALACETLGNAVFERMRVALAPPDYPMERHDAFPVALRSSALPARSVTGEILRDGAGRYYENHGNHLRELGKLEASPDGGLVEVQQPEPARMLFSEPGHRCVLRWGEVKALLAGQMAHPERLRDEHRILCHVQVVQAGARQRVEELAGAVFGDASVARELFPLSPQAVVRLDLRDVLPPQCTQPAGPQERGMVAPGDRLCRLRVADDPTADPPPPPAPKRQVPEPFGSRNFPRSRDDVLLQMRTPARASERLAAFARSLFLRARFDRWQRALWGKTSDEQLWAVPPPAGMLADPAVREWATCTLEAAGYDAPAMLREWEIYWRRSGEATS